MATPNTPYTTMGSEQVLRRSFDETQDRLRVDAEITATIGAVEVDISAADGDTVALSDGTNNVTLTQSSGKTALDVNVINPGATGTQVYQNYFDEVTGIAQSVPTTILSYEADPGEVLHKVNVSGSNIATYELVINNQLVDKKRTYFGGQLNVDFDADIQLQDGDVVEVTVTHLRPSLGDFNACIKIAS